MTADKNLESIGISILHSAPEQRAAAAFLPAETTRWTAGLSTSRGLATGGAVFFFGPPRALPLPCNRQTRRYRLRPLPGAGRARRNSGRDRLRARPPPESASAPPPLRKLLWSVPSKRNRRYTA